MHCGVEVTESSTNKQHNLSDLGLTDAADVGYFRSPGLAYASEFLDSAVSPASLSLLVLWPSVLCGWFWAYLGRFWAYVGAWFF